MLLRRLSRCRPVPSSRGTDLAAFLLLLALSSWVLGLTERALRLVIP